MHLRKSSKRNIMLVAIVCAGYFLVTYIMDASDTGDNKQKIILMEQSINQLGNQGKCKIPVLPIDAPEMMKFLADEEPIDCGPDEDWVTCEMSLCSIKRSLIEKKGLITCDFTDIIRKSDHKFEYGITARTTNSYTLRVSDFVRVKCFAENRDRWYGTGIGVRIDSNIIKRTKSYIRPQALNVLMLGFDSLSRNAFIRKLPKTYHYLTNELNADVLKGYNIIGDGTPQALIPLLTGFTELELPETRKRKFSSSYVNSYPMIWKEYQKEGYVTSFNEDQPEIGTFSYRLNGFDETPTDHYMRTYYLAVESDLHTYKRLCIGSEKSHNVMLDYTKNFMLKYNSTAPRFVFSFHAQLSHDSINLIGVADDDIVNWLMSMKGSGILNNTILIMMSDHGNRFADIRDSLQGKLEERLPFFSFTFPEWFKNEYPTQYKNFQRNVERLTTPFDIHATLQDILYLQQSNRLKKVKNSRSISLFNVIPEDRSCANAFIEPHWCSCLQWNSQNDTTSENVRRAAKTVVRFINQLTHSNRDICEELKLDEIKWSAKLIPQKNLLQFKQNADVDGFMPDLTSNTKINNEMYQVKITTFPGKAIYEASIMHNLLENEFKVKLSDISRVNKYGSQAACIYESNPEIRKYCYCKPTLHEAPRV
ncbi:unnamed protein product [Diamesa serratosioi]